MKFIILFISIFISHLAFGQKLMQHQIWIGDSLEYLRIDKSLGRCLFSDRNGMSDIKDYSINGDTLLLRDWFRSSSDNYKTLQHSDYKFLISSIKKSIFLKPLDTNSLKLSGNRKEIKFQPINTLYIKHFNFDSLKFSTTSSHPNFPEMTIIIKGKEFYFSGGKYAIKQGEYKISMPDSIYTQLKDHLRKSAIKKVENLKVNITSAPSYYTLTIFYKQNKKTIEGYELPLLLRNLQTFLLSLPKKFEPILK